ncbi:hypothetical protein B0I35DRAFT_427182 [Stachybotrys elegans]|uniref:Uncharacterized protein n=1 Tax=Stachybotrys elegans TaxID=80388 RepID=A0A8K0SSF9_9HYPO|nr:hypothetical protein B0I35DRAFT_427182 [Stachybotrys elegans]
MSDVIPAACYEPCNSAYEIAQLIGTSQEVCEDGSAFRIMYDLCIECIRDRRDDQATPREYPTDDFQKLLARCEFATTVTNTFTQIDGQVLVITYGLNAPTASVTTTTGSTTTSLDDDVETTLSEGDGQVDQSERYGKDWIAGPAVGSAVALSILAGLFLFFRHRSKTSLQSVEGPEKFEKAQLHSDSIPHPFIHQADSRTIHEMEELRPRSPRAEKPANEPAAQELPA